MFTLRDTVSSLTPARQDDLGKSLYERFREEPDTLIVPVVDAEDRPIGLVERNAFFLRMAAEYGRALYANRPISTLMDSQPLVVDADTMALLRRHPTLLDMYKYTSGGTVADAQIAQAFRVQNIWMAGGLKNVANEGQTKSLVNIWGNSAVLAYVPPGGGGTFSAPTAGAVRFQWTNDGIYGAGFNVMRTVRNEAGSEHAEIIECGHFQAEKVTARDLIYTLTGTL